MINYEVFIINIFTSRLKKGPVLGYKIFNIRRVVGLGLLCLCFIFSVKMISVALLCPVCALALLSYMIEFEKWARRPTR